MVGAEGFEGSFPSDHYAVFFVRFNCKTSQFQGLTRILRRTLLSRIFSPVDKISQEFGITWYHPKKRRPGLRAPTPQSPLCDFEDYVSVVQPNIGKCCHLGYYLGQMNRGDIADMAAYNSVARHCVIEGLRRDNSIGSRKWARTTTETIDGFCWPALFDLTSGKENARRAQDCRRDGIDVVLAQEPQRNAVTKFRIHSSQPGLHDSR